MAQTFKRICLMDYPIQDANGTTFTLRRAKEYITSPVREDGTVLVFSQYWVRVPVTLFAGEQEFTKGALAE